MGEYIDLAAILAIGAVLRWQIVSLERRMGALEARVGAGFKEQDARIDARFKEQEARFNARFDKLEARMDKQDARMDRLETRVADMDRRLARLEGRSVGSQNPQPDPPAPVQ